MKPIEHVIRTAADGETEMGNATVNRIAEIEAQIDAREADGDEDHFDLTGAIDFHRSVPFHKLAWNAGYDNTLPRSEQSAHFIEWLEAYEAEADRYARATCCR